MCELLRYKTLTVLESALENTDQFVVASCRRLIVASRRGWRQYRDQRDVELVNDLFEACRQ